MREKQSQQSLLDSNRRTFLSGVAGALAAAAYTRSVPTEAAARVTNGEDDPVQRIDSPDGSISVTVDASDGLPTYEVAVDGTTYVDPSTVGFEFRNQPTFGAGEDDGVDLEVTGTDRESATEEWEPVWGEFERVSEPYESLVVGLTETEDPARSANLEVRVFDDGVGMRVVLDESFASNSDRAVVTAENTEFAFAGDYTSWWIPNEVVNPRFEQEYTETPLSEISGGSRETEPTGTPMRNGAHTPLTVRADDDAYLSVHEADLEDYASATLAPRSEDGGTTFDTELTPLPDGTKASLELPTATPWRTIQIGRRDGDLIESQLIPLLSSALKESVLPTVDGEPDTDWIEPRKYIGIWWTMIAGSANWEYRTDEEIAADGEDPASYIHGARTERMKRYMTFAAENGIDSVLVEGWNQGWDTYPGDGTGLEFGVDESYPDFDVREVTDFGGELEPAVEMTMHNETAGALPNYEEQILEDDIFAQYEDVGIHSIKNGYVSDPGLGIDGDGTEATHNQHNQLAVNHHRLVIEEAAANRQLLEIHEGIKPTGEIRTYPNVANREVVTAQEFDGFDQLSSNVGEEHHVTIPFTRNLAGPVSYQPGIFDITFTDDRGDQVQTTRAKQLAMYPNYLSGLQMAADRLEAYISPELEVGELVQAAAGEIEGFITLDEWRNAFGTNAVAVDPNRVPSGSSVSVTVRDAAAGTYDLHLRYASAPEDNAERVIEAGGPQATLRVNDETRTIEPDFTDYWDRWEVLTTEIELAEGDNEIAVELDYEDGETFEGDVGGFNLNTIAVTEPGDASPVPADYEGYTPERENFAAEPEFEFIENVPAADWDETAVVDSAIGDYVVTARRDGEEWYVGAMTDESGRAVDVPLEFLAPGSSGDAGQGAGPRGPNYVAEIYSDGIGGGYESDPEAVRIDEAIVDPSTTLLASMARSGGTAIRLRRARGRERSELPTYERPTQDLAYAIDEDAGLGEPFITATGDNDSAFVGGTTVAVEVDGDRVALDNVRLSPGASDETFEFGYTIAAPGDYDVALRDPDGGDVLASATVTVSPGELVAQFDDPQGDDHGPGEYVYPTDDDFRDGAFDLRSVAVYESETDYLFALEIEELYDVFGGEFSPHYFVTYLRDPSRADGRTTELGDLAITAEFESEWHYRIGASGFESAVVDADENDLGSAETFVDFETDTVIVSVGKDAFGADFDIEDAEILPIVGSEDFGAFRPVEVEAGGFVFGGAREGAVENAPRIIDMLTPPDVDQSAALDYDAESLATLPFTPL
ncbi:glycoside hydrolase family 97 catalytic domain-containing protein [Natronococcus sp. A-GB7]|uniref:glycoside hydrolase family 97 catalytic domain-containing protein n=1 Tax=Natronococcus sp. A-GB7 TaxID=3037649 RepID=UPI00241F2B46|nr:glycoside hydrolase family 97 catalytic domain-containing protein [Natronococcus sp. A-GB7]MDG5817491.1 glycoside hydrolase family 97 catalytic domain-containing protein [Natronococcus sp. A-GB7]